MIAIGLLTYPVIVALAVGSAALISHLGGVWPPWLFATPFRRGVGFGATLVGACWWSRELARLLAAGAERDRKGAEGEELTDRALRPLRWRGWRVVNDIEFPGEGNVDHLLIGPSGVVAIDSKYTTERLWVTAKAIGGSHRRFIRDARWSATLAKRAVAAVGHPDIPVDPALVFWGPGAPEIPGGHLRVQATVVVEGRRARQWRSSLRNAPKVLDERTVREVTRALEAFRAA